MRVADDREIEVIESIYEALDGGDPERALSLARGETDAGGEDRVNGQDLSLTATRILLIIDDR